MPPKRRLRLEKGRQTLFSALSDKGKKGASDEGNTETGESATFAPSLDPLSDPTPELSNLEKLNNLNEQCVTVTKFPCGDRFKLNIPYAGITLTWEVLFDSNFPEDPPDFIFSTEDEDFSPDIQDIKSLRDWDHMDPGALTSVVEELLQLYRDYQLRQIEAYSRLTLQLNSMLEDENNTKIDSQDVEIFLYIAETKLGPVNFLIKLPVDYTQIPAYVTKDNPGTDTSVLLLTLPHPDSARITPQLYLSPRVEHALGGSSSLRIPAFPNGGLMGDYVVGISQLLQNKVDQIVLNFDRRRDYMAALLSYFGRSVLEFDADTFRKISLLFEWNDFFFILHIEVPQFFPQEKPILSFQSIYHECKGKPYTEVHEEYPYSPRWSGSEMAERARVYILDNIKDFQIQSVRSGVL